MIQVKDILISVVNGNDKGYIDECVRSLYRMSQGFSFDVVVIDNCTGYQGLDSLEEIGATVIINDNPMGFAENHAQLREKAKDYRYWLIFNDDAYLLNNAFCLMMNMMDGEQDIAICGCNITDPDGKLQPSTSSFPTLKYFMSNQLGLDVREGERFSTYLVDYIDYTKSQYVDWVTGCCMMIRMSFVEKHGFLDTNYFMFVEDADLCRRAVDYGYKVKYLADAKVAHYGAGSSKDQKGKYKPRLFVERQRSRLYYLRKYSTVQYAAYFLFINVYIFGKLIRDMVGGRREQCNELLRSMRFMPIM